MGQSAENVIIRFLGLLMWKTEDIQFSFGQGFLRPHRSRDVQESQYLKSFFFGLNKVCLAFMENL